MLLTESMRLNFICLFHLLLGLASQGYAGNFDLTLTNYTDSLQEKAKLDVFLAFKKDKSGWMNVLGDWVIPPIYDAEGMLPWREGILICKKEGKYGAINAKNEIIVPFEYNKAISIWEHGTIIVVNDKGERAYFSKKGKQLCEFNKKSLPEFNLGFAVSTSNSKILGGYPRLDLLGSKKQQRSTQIYTCDFALINTNFDTLLFIENSPFLIQLGTLNNGQRSFVIHPYMALHADLGISYGMYGYLNENGEISIPPQFETLPGLTPNSQGVVRTADFQFHSNRALVRAADNKFYYINKQGEKAFDIKVQNPRILNITPFNDHGIAGIRSALEKPNSIMLHLIDTAGKIIFEGLDSEVQMTIGGAISSYPSNSIIPISDRKKQELRIYTSAFELINSFPLKDSLYHYKYSFHFADKSMGKSILMQTRYELIYKIRGAQKRLIQTSGTPVSDWHESKEVLSYAYNNYFYFDSSNMQYTLTDLSKKELYSCQSCEFIYEKQIGKYGLYRVNGDGKRIYVNFKGDVISDSFSSMEEKIYPLSEQTANSKPDEIFRLNLDKSALFEIFNQSIMHQRIINSKNRE